MNAERAGAYLLTLEAIAPSACACAGLRHISQIRLDTLSDPRRFFSHRRMTLGGHAHTGCQISAIKAGKRI
ncbi:MAG: laccase domain-containing protein [Acetobacteraceae bacterium]